MQHKRFKVYRLILITGILLLTANVCQQRPDIPKNVILFIADGCGYNQVDAASLYQYGRTGLQVYEGFPVKFGMSTYPADEVGYDPDTAWESFDYVKQGATDSAASATAMATGVKTHNKAINVDTEKKRLEHLFEKAKQYGKATGVVSTVQFSHATGACFGAHNVKRSNYDEIAWEMIMESSLDVIMGCGHPLYNQTGGKAILPRTKYVGGEEVWEALVAGTAGNDFDGDGIKDPWTLIQTREEFQSMGSGSTPKRVIGIPQIYKTLQQERSGDGMAPPFVVPLVETVPNLKEMALAAINVLDDHPDGFYLMIEGGAVDWACHDLQFGRMIEEQIDFNHAIEAVIDWIEIHSNWEETLVIVTSDHETGFLYGPNSGSGNETDNSTGPAVWNPISNLGKGKVPEMVWYAEDDHTNSLVPFYAKGVGSDRFIRYADEIDPVRGRYLDNTEIAFVLFSFLK